MIEPTVPFAPDWVSSPGDTIADLIEERGWTQAEFAKRLGYSAKYVNRLVQGNAAWSGRLPCCRRCRRRRRRTPDLSGGNRTGHREGSGLRYIRTH